MKKFANVPIAAFALAVVMAAALLLPISAMASRQSNKNLFRNLAIGGGAVGAYGLLHHNNTLGLLGLAAGGYSAYRYEQERKAQSQAAHRRAYLYHRQTYYHRTVGNYNQGNRRYYIYNGHQYYENLSTGARVRVH